jgi:hypothetical protein
MDSLRPPGAGALGAPSARRAGAGAGLLSLLLLPLLAASPLLAAASNPAAVAAPALAGVERVVLTTEGGVPFPTDCYRPSGTISRGTAVFLPDPIDSLAVWAGVARLFAGRGYTVFVPEIMVRRAAAPLAVWGRPEDPGAPWAAAWEEVVAILAHTGSVPGSEGAVFLGGTGLGAAAAAVAASRLSHPPAALLLVAPVRELTRLPLGPLLAGLAVPTLVLAPIDDRNKADAAREIHLAARATCRLWSIDGFACTPRTLEERPLLAVDVADWIERQLPRGIPAVDARGTPTETERR